MMLKGGLLIGAIGHREDATRNITSTCGFRILPKARMGKDRARGDRRMSLSEAVSEHVRDNALMSDTGFSSVWISIQAHFEILRRR